MRKYLFYLLTKISTADIPCSHRLSTITSADQILVLHEGSVFERGTHDELLAKKGRYYNMWRKQIRAEKAAEEARVLSDRAAALRERAMSEETSDNDGDTDKSDKSVSENTENASDATRAASGALGIAADAFRRGADLIRGSTDDGKPSGHP